MMKHQLMILACLLLALLQAQTAGAQAAAKAQPTEGESLTVVDVTRCGAKGDGVKDCTKALNAAIARCAKKGGGRVVVPAGRYLTATVVLQSGVELHLQEGAVLVAEEDAEAYSSLEPQHDLSRYDSGGGTANANCSSDQRWTKALVLGNGLHDIAITGKGEIDGRHVFDAQGEEQMRGPHTIVLAECKNVRMEDITIRRAANYAVLGYALEDAVFRGMHIAEGWDGIHIRGAQRVSISNCRFETGDDAIAGGYWEEMTIAHCDINSACNGVRIIMPCQGVDIGHCRLHGPGTYAHRTSGKQQRRNMLFGISLEPGGWGSAPGDMRGIRLHDLTMDRLSAPVSVSIRKECHAHDLTLENITATHVEGAMSATVCWNDTGFDRITVNNVNLSRNNP